MDILKPIHDMAVPEHAVTRGLEKAKLVTENRTYKEHLEDEIQKLRT